MPYSTDRRRTVLAVTAALAASAAIAAPASASVAAPAGGCPTVATSQPFLAWQDVAAYTLAPGGSLEGGTAGWQLGGGAAAVEGNEPFQVGGPGDHTALALAPGDTAATAPMCIGIENRTVRFFARGTAGSSLDVEVLYGKSNGKQQALRLGSVAGNGAWAPTAALPMLANTLAAAQSGNTLDVSLRFTPRGAGSWTIDDVYVDPYRRG